MDFNGGLWTLVELVIVDFNGVFFRTLPELILWTLVESLRTLAALCTLEEVCCEISGVVDFR